MAAVPIPRAMSEAQGGVPVLQAPAPDAAEQHFSSKASRSTVADRQGAGVFQKHCRELVAEYESLQALCHTLSHENAVLTAQVRRMLWVPSEPLSYHHAPPPAGAAASPAIAVGPSPSLRWADAKELENHVEAGAMAGVMEAAAAIIALQDEGGAGSWEELRVPHRKHTYSEACQSPRPKVPSGDDDCIDASAEAALLAALRPRSSSRKTPTVNSAAEDTVGAHRTCDDLLSGVIPMLPPESSSHDRQHPSLAQRAAARAVAAAAAAESWTEEENATSYLSQGFRASDRQCAGGRLSHHGTREASFATRDGSKLGTADASARLSSASKESHAESTAKGNGSHEEVGVPRKTTHTNQTKASRKAERQTVNIKELEAQVVGQQRSSLGCRAERLEGLIKGEQLEGAKSICSAILKHWLFDAFVGVVIIVNSITIGIESSYAAKGQDELPTFLIVLEPIFLSIYITELGTRLFVYGYRVLRDPWVFFDLILVVCGLVGLLTNLVFSAPDSVLQDIMLIRTMRLARLARAVRLLVQFRTLWLLVQGLIHSCTTLCWTFVIMFALIYVFAIVGLEIVRDDPSASWEYREKYQNHFSGLGFTMLTLLQVLTLDSVGQIYTPLIVAKPELAVYFVAFILLASVALTNLVTAIMVESSMAQANNDKEGRAEWLNARKKAMIPKLKAIFEEMDKDGSGELQLEEVLEAPPWVKEHLTLVANLSDVEEIFHMIDYDGSGAVTIEEFVEGITKANETNKPMELMRIMKQAGDILRYTRLIWFFLESLAQQQGTDAVDVIGRGGPPGASELLLTVRQREPHRGPPAPPPISAAAGGPSPANDEPPVVQPTSL